MTGVHLSRWPPALPAGLPPAETCFPVAFGTPLIRSWPVPGRVGWTARCGPSAGTGWTRRRGLPGDFPARVADRGGGISTTTPGPPASSCHDGGITAGKGCRKGSSRVGVVSSGRTTLTGRARSGAGGVRAWWRRAFSQRLGTSPGTAWSGRRYRSRKRELCGLWPGGRAGA